MALTPYPSLATLPEVAASGGKVPTVFGGASRSVVFLSGAGIVADGTTDNSTRLQAILDLAQSGPLRIVHDMAGTILADGLLVWSGTTIETLRGGSWKKKGYGGTVAGLGKPMFQNRHIVAGGTNPTDANIHVVGGYWDGNRRGFSSGGTTAYWATHGGAGQAAIANNSGEVVPLLGFYGVAGCSARDLDFYDLGSYGVHLGNARDAVAENITKAIAVGDTFPGDNAVQLEGYCQGIRIAGIRGTSNDDLVAINANDGLDLYPASSPTTFQAGIVSGPIRDVVVRDLAHTGGSGTLLRMLNGNKTISNILIEGIRVESTSTSTQACVYFNNIGISGSPVFEDITIRDVRGVSPSATGLVLIDDTNSAAAFNNIVIDGVSARGGGRAPVGVASGAINQLVLTNVVSHGNPYLLDVTGGSIADMQLGSWSATGLTADIHDAGSRIASLRRSGVAAAVANAKPASPAFQSGNAQAANLVAFLVAHEGTGSTVHDLCPSPNDGAVSGSVWTAFGLFSGPGLTFSGQGSDPAGTVSNRVQLSSTAKWAQAGSVSVCVSVRLTSNADQVLAACFGNDTTPAGHDTGWLVGLGDGGTGKIKWVTGASGASEVVDSLASATVLSAGVKYDIVCTYDSSTGAKKIYINGSLDASNTWGAGPILYAGAKASVGCFCYTEITTSVASQGAPALGVIDHVKVYSAAIDSTLVSADHADPFAAVRP